jgi:hypothetical protein
MSVGPALLAQLRRRAEQELTDDCLVEPLVTTNNGDGTYSQSYGTPVETKCMVAPFRLYRSAGGTGGGQVQELGSWQITLPAGTVVAKSSRITNSVTGQKFEVVGVGGPRTLEITLIVYAEEAVD